MEEQTIQQPQSQKPQFPSEVITLPSEGKYYHSESPLASGTIELYYPSARSEDILTSKNLITKGVVIDKFLESLVVDPRVNLDEMLVGDKNALIVASRILAYGKDYKADITCPSCNEAREVTIDLSNIGTKAVTLPETNVGNTGFEVTLPASKAVVRFRLVTNGDEKQIDSEMKAMKKIVKTSTDPEITTRLKYAIISVDGNTDRTFIKRFVDNMLSIDSLELRKALVKNTPDVDMKFEYECSECGHTERMILPLGVSFFWPSSQVE